MLNIYFFPGINEASFRKTLELSTEVGTNRDRFMLALSSAKEENTTAFIHLFAERSLYAVIDPK